MTNLANTIREIRLRSFTTFVARVNALNNHNDSYHLQMAIHEHGEQAVLVEMSHQIAQEESISFTEASRKASHFIEYTLNASLKRGFGKSVRDTLNDSTTKRGH
ncbi:hypothetical protein TUM4438_01120 [Shewanella sairae]|uniref:Uncharacterized protein n=1 Tax=Shewanella sairae TaxID=190310 RepID=A0ABQ4NZ24_9GAMM|nr:hypothetical protein [Shewanella sairae]MCL1130989.1 hypothetical protein [Shewanella sairae]GIU40283.1 hypothetical protein TUM4438_01120 [Shewanella sairae]